MYLYLRYLYLWKVLQKEVSSLNRFEVPDESSKNTVVSLYGY